MSTALQKPWMKDLPLPPGDRDVRGRRSELVSPEAPG